MFRLLLRLWLLSSALLVLGRAAPPAAAPVAATSTAKDYLLQPQDLLRVVVFREPNLLSEVRVSQEYSIKLPLIEENIDLRNKTLRQAEQLIRDLYDRDYLVNPQVNLTVLEYARRTVNVIGQVANPGAIQFPPEQKLTLIDAITRAGGFSRLANKRQVQVTRASGETVIVNAEHLLRDGAAAEKWTLMVGDTVNVPERVL